MDIHKPKAWHSLREFLKEYLIIVIGVLTALGAEQIAENIHWQAKVGRAEEAEKPELQALYFNALERDRLEDCMARRIDAIEAALLATRGAWTPLPPMRVMGRETVLQTPNRGYRDQVWKSLVADGTASHLPPARQHLYGDVMGWAEGIEARNGVETTENAAFNLLQHRVELSSDMRNGLIVKLEQEKSRSYLLSVNGRQLINNIKQLTTPDRKAAEEKLVNQSGTYQACYGAGLLPPGSPAPRAPTNEERRMFGVPTN